MHKMAAAKSNKRHNEVQCTRNIIQKYWKGSSISLDIFIGWTIPDWLNRSCWELELDQTENSLVMSEIGANSMCRGWIWWHRIETNVLFMEKDSKTCNQHQWVMSPWTEKRRRSDIDCYLSFEVCEHFWSMIFHFVNVFGALVIVAVVGCILGWLVDIFKQIAG